MSLPPYQFDKLQKIRAKKKNNKKKSVSKLESARKLAEKLKDDQTDAEIVFKEILQHYKIEYEFQKIIFVNKERFFIVDFYLPKHNVCVELDGYYHTTLKGKEKDKKRDGLLRKKKKVLIYRFMNSHVFCFTSGVQRFCNKYSKGNAWNDLKNH